MSARVPTGHIARVSSTIGLIAVLCAAAISLAGCILPGVDRPQAAAPAPLRYRDAVFSSVDVAKDLQYGSAPALDGSGSTVDLKLDLYTPAGDTVAKRPAIVWVHGGGYVGGDKATGVAATISGDLAREGYVVASINYRLIKTRCDAKNGIPADCYAAAIAAVHDAQAAVRWLRANAAAYGIDEDRIGIGGESAGAITATGVGVYSDQPGESGNPGYPSTVRGWVSISGGLPGGVFVDEGDAPGYLFSGTADTTVPYQWSVETAQALDRAGVPVVLRTLDGAGHVPWQQFRTLFEEQSTNFFYQYLDAEHAGR